MREHPRSANVSVIALTGNATRHEVARGKESGFEDFLTMPLENGSLIAIRDRHLDKAIVIATNTTDTVI